VQVVDFATHFYCDARKGRIHVGAWTWVFNFEHSTMGPFDIIPSLRSILAYKWDQVNRAGGKKHGGDKDYFGLRSERESIEKAIPSWEHLIGSSTGTSEADVQSVDDSEGSVPDGGSK
jgi:hypothetical protein